MDRRQQLLVGHRYRLHSGGRLWPWRVPTTDDPCQWDVRRGGHLSRRDWSDRSRPGTTRTFLRLRRWLKIDRDCPSERIDSRFDLLDDAGEYRDLPEPVRVASGCTPVARSSRIGISRLT